MNILSSFTLSPELIEIELSFKFFYFFTSLFQDIKFKIKFDKKHNILEFFMIQMKPPNLLYSFSFSFSLQLGLYMPAGLYCLIYGQPACTSCPKDKSRDSFRCQAIKQLLTGFLFSNCRYPT